MTATELDWISNYSRSFAQHPMCHFIPSSAEIVRAPHNYNGDGKMKERKTVDTSELSEAWEMI